MSEVEELNKVSTETIKPTMNRLLVQIVREKEFYGSTNIKKVNSKIEVEPYAYVVCVGPQVVSDIKPGNIVLLSASGRDMYKLFGTGYSLISEFDVLAVISSEIAEEITKQIASKEVADKLKI